MHGRKNIKLHNALWLVYAHLLMPFFLKEIPFFIYAHLSGIRLEHKTRPWYIYLVQLQSTVHYIFNDSLKFCDHGWPINGILYVKLQTVSGIVPDDRRRASFHNIVHIKYTSGNGKYPTYFLTAIYVVIRRYQI